MFKHALLTLLLATAVSAQRPKIGLALGSGGARGSAHVGILRALEEQHIPIDYIAGTSMGAVVGGLYASGLTPDEIEHALTTTDWRDALNDRTRYEDLAYRRKEDENRYLTALEAGLRRGRVTLPGGLSSGQKLRFLLQSQFIPVAGTRDFSTLPVPFKAVAADIETGEAVVLGHGDLAEAVRASMSIPGVFSPVEIDGKLLVDGGVADSVPVDVVRAMGADIVIAVDVGSPLLKRGQLGSLVAVTSQVLTILTRANAQQQLAKADVVLIPPVSQYGTMDFERAKEIIAAGAAYGREQSALLQQLAVTPETFAETLAARPRREASSRVIDYLGIEGSQHVDHRIVRRHVASRPGQPLDSDTLRADVTRLYSLDDFQEVTFAVRDEEGQHGLVLNLKDKPWGPTYVRFGMNLSDDLRGQSSYDLVVSVTQTRLNALGGEWRTDLRLGRGLGVFSELYQPLDFGGRFFVAPSIQSVRNTFSLYEGDHRRALYDVEQHALTVDLGTHIGDAAELRAGVYRGRTHAGVDAGEIDLRHGSIDSGGMRALLSIINTDRPTFPRHGASLTAEYHHSLNSFSATDQYSRLAATGYLAFTRGKQTLLAGAAGGTSLGTHLPVYDEFRLGGLLNLSGFAEGQVHGQKFALARLGTYRRIRTLPAQLGDGVYAGAIGEIGNAWLADEPPSTRNLHKSLSLFAGADTIVGPMFIAYSRTEKGRSRFYVTVGKTF